MEHPSTSLSGPKNHRHPSMEVRMETHTGYYATHRYFLHNKTHIVNLRIFALPCSASIIALNTASENVHSSNLDVSNEWATPMARAPSTTNVHPRATNFNFSPIHHGRDILQSLKMGVVVHAFNKPCCILDVDPIQSCNFSFKIIILQTPYLSMKHRCLVDADMRLHNPIPLPFFQCPKISGSTQR